MNADALPFDLHRDQFQTSTTSSGLSTDDDDFDDDEEDRVHSEDGRADSAAATLTSHSDAIPDLIPNPRITAADQVQTAGFDVLEDRPSSDPPLHNGRSDDLGRSSPHDVQKSRLLSVSKNQKIINFRTRYFFDGFFTKLKKVDILLFVFRMSGKISAN